jgi:hypothetical protein
MNMNRDTDQVAERFAARQVLRPSENPLPRRRRSCYPIHDRRRDVVSAAGPRLDERHGRLLWADAWAPSDRSALTAIRSDRRASSAAMAVSAGTVSASACLHDMGQHGHSSSRAGQRGRLRSRIRHWTVLLDYNITPSHHWRRRAFSEPGSGMLWRSALRWPRVPSAVQGALAG